MSRVFVVPGIHPHPELREVVHHNKLPGGLPPVPYRNPWNRAGDTGRGAREPFNSKECKREFWCTMAYLDGNDFDSRNT